MIIYLKKFFFIIFYKRKTLYRYIVDSIPFLKTKKFFNKLLIYPKVLIRLREAKKIYNPIHFDNVSKLETVGLIDASKLMNQKLLIQLDNEINKIMNNDFKNLESERTTKSFWKQLINKADLKSSSLFAKFALQEEIVSIASMYFGSVPYLHSINLFVSNPDFDQTKWEKSQLWHRDYADSKCLKLWTYFNDVLDDKNGPFTYIPANAKSINKIPRFPTHKKDKVFEKAGLLKFKKKQYGEKFSSFLIDTFSCWHQGSRLKKNGLRIGLVATYISDPAFYKYDNLIKIDSDLSEIDSLILTRK